MGETYRSGLDGRAGRGLRYEYLYSLTRYPSVRQVFGSGRCRWTELEYRLPPGPAFQNTACIGVPDTDRGRLLILRCLPVEGHSRNRFRLLDAVRIGPAGENIRRHSYDGQHQRKRGVEPGRI